jgi:glycosyltransferase involved in cell wall biosynthesis
MRKFIKKETPDIIHAHGTRAAFWARLAVSTFKNRPRVIYTLHGFHILKRNFYTRWLLLVVERFLNHWTDVLVCVSEADKNLVLKYKTIPLEKIRLIKNGIDVEKFQMTPKLIDSLKRELGIENSFVLTTIGRLHPQKDFSTIIKTLKLIISQDKNFKLLVIGDGPLRKSLEKEAEGLGLNQYVRFLGFREDISMLIDISDIIILSTKWEGLPLVPLEAGVCKKPVIASDVDGIRETIIDKKTGYLFKPASEKDLASKILKLSKSKELREKIGESAFEFISKNFDKRKMVENYKDLYISVISS